MTRARKTAICNYFLIIVGAAFYAAGVVLFLEPNQMVPGGISGISVMVHAYTGIGTGILTFAFNIPLLIVAVIRFGRRFFYSTIHAVLWSSLFMEILLPIGALTKDLLLAAVAGGALVALGLGIVFRCRATTGGSDIIVRLLKLKYRHVKTGVLVLIFDALVIAASVFAFGKLDLALYSGIGVLVQSFLFDAVLYGSDSAKLVYIVSDDPDRIVERFLKELTVGVTSMRAVGSYTGKDRKLLLCAMHRQVLPQARKIVRDTDENAFMIITPATQIFGEGFLRHDREDL